MTRPKVIAIAGGSCSGKTTLCQLLKETLGEEAAVIFQDSYYIDQSESFCGDGSVNYDHPNSIDFDLLEKHLDELRNGNSIEVPIYDFKSHKRLNHARILHPSRYILVDGTLILSQNRLRSKFDHRIFIRTPEEIRFQRRLDRDVKERGRLPDGIRKQFQEHVKPMHDQFVEPSCDHAETVIQYPVKLANAVRQLLADLSEQPDFVH